MKKLFQILFGLAFCVSYGLAQGEAVLKIVGEAQKVDGEFIGKEMRDANGEWCAGLIIYSDVKGLEFSSNNGIVKRNSDPGKDFLFLSPDERVVDVYSVDYKNLKIFLSDLGIRLKSGEIWSITIEGEKFIPVNFIITPNGTKLTIDKKDEDMSKAPQLKVGKHIIRISKQGFETVIDTINVSPSNALFAYNLKEKLGAAKREVADFSIPLDKTYGFSAIVSKFTSVGGVSGSELTDIRNSVLTGLSQSGKYDIINITEDELTEIQSKNVTGSLSEREMSVKIGHAKKAGIVFSAVVNKSAAKYLMTITMYDVATGSIVATQPVSTEGYVYDMLPDVEIAAQKIAGTYEEPSYTWYYIGGAVLVGGTAAAVLLQPEKVIVPPVDNSLPQPPDKPIN